MEWRPPDRTGGAPRAPALRGPRAASGIHAQDDSVLSSALNLQFLNPKWILVFKGLDHTSDQGPKAVFLPWKQTLRRHFPLPVPSGCEAGDWQRR